MGLRDALRNNENAPVVKRQKVVPGPRTFVPVIHEKKQKKHNHRILNKFLYYLLMHLEKTEVCANNIDGCRR
jgi:hypothetical protein